MTVIKHDEVRTENCLPLLLFFHLKTVHASVPSSPSDTSQLALLWHPENITADVKKILKHIISVCIVFIFETAVGH